jgi:hypothetical protein
MPYAVTPEDMASISDAELAFSTERLLPAWEDISVEFQRGNLYTKLAEAIFFGHGLPDCQIELNEGFDPLALNRAVRVHLQSFGPKHEHKIAGVGYMIAQAAILHQEAARAA